MAAPSVLNLQDTIAQLRAAQQGNYDTLTQQEKNLATNEANQTAGLAAKKDAAFGQITDQAASRGALFSGFTPDGQAKYTSATYLPALANLQKAITDSRTAIQGQRNSLDSNISTEAIKQVEGSKTALQQWQDARDAAAAAANTHNSDQAFTAHQNDLNRSNARSVASLNHVNSGGLTPADILAMQKNAQATENSYHISRAADGGIQVGKYKPGDTTGSLSGSNLYNYLSDTGNAKNFQQILQQSSNSADKAFYAAQAPLYAQLQAGKINFDTYLSEISKSAPGGFQAF